METEGRTKRISASVGGLRGFGRVGCGTGIAEAPPPEAVVLVVEDVIVVVVVVAVLVEGRGRSGVTLDLTASTRRRNESVVEEV